jgi:methylated-DNA-[protein]-cysteine S-methyltransferase
MTLMEGVYVEPIGCYLMVELSDGKLKRVCFSAYHPASSSSVLALQIAEHLICDRPCHADLDQSVLTDFQREVFSVVSAIQRGKTLTYGQVAWRMGRPGIARAVGRALWANPFAVLIPCHRVLSKNGLGGYRWGVELKKKLLAIEVAGSRGSIRL